MISPGFSPRLASILPMLGLAIFLSSCPTFAADWIHLPPKEGAANGKKIVFVTGDDEYRSETSIASSLFIPSQSV